MKKKFSPSSRHAKDYFGRGYLGSHRGESGVFEDEEGNADVQQRKVASWGRGN